MNPSPALACPAALRQTGSGWTLVGNRCISCGEYFFPAQRACAHCCGTQMEACDIGSVGTLWSWTIQGFLPKPPYNSGETEQNFKPYGVAYVQMPSGIKVESRLTVADPARLKIGMPMALTLEPYRTTPDGERVFTFVFAPADAHPSHGGSST